MLRRGFESVAWLRTLDHSLNSYIFGFLAVFGITLLSVLGMLVVRRYVNLEVLTSYHQVAGYLLSVVGMMYSVLLGFVIVDSMHHMQDVRQLVSMEASGLANVFLCSEGLPAPKRSEIRSLCHEYAEEVINDEWHELRRGLYSRKTFRSVFKIWKAITTFEPKTKSEDDIQQQLTNQICALDESHRARVISAAHGVAPVLWLVLIVGGVFTVGFTYFFGVKSLRAQILMTVLLTVILSLNLYLVFAFGNPMSRDLGVVPGPFKLDLMIFDSFDSLSMPKESPVFTSW